MKQLIVIMAMLTGLYACTDKNKQGIAPEPAWGTDSASATFNDSIIWSANGLRLKSTNDTILGLRLDINKQLSNGEIYPFESMIFGMLRKNLSIQKLDSTGYQPSNVITEPNAFFFDMTDYDAGNENFEVYRPDSANNWIQITEQRNNYKEIKGIFSVTLVKTQVGSVYIYPDTLRVRNGYFRATIKD